MDIGKKLESAKAAYHEKMAAIKTRREERDAERKSLIESGELAPRQMQHIHFFEVDSKKQKFCSVFATLLSLDDYEMRVRIKSNDYKFTSDFPLRELLVAGGALLLAYSMDGCLFPLPEIPDVTLATGNSAFSTPSQKDFDDLVSDSPAMIKANEDFEKSKSAFRQAWEWLLNHAADFQDFAKAIPRPSPSPLANAAPSAVKAASVGFTQKREQIDVLPRGDSRSKRKTRKEIQKLFGE